MEYLDNKRYPSDKQIETDLEQSREWRRTNHVTRIEDGIWKRNGETIRQAPAPTKYEQREGWTDSPWNWR